MTNLQFIIVIGGSLTAALALYSIFLATKLAKKSKPVVNFSGGDSKAQLDAKQSVRVIAQALIQKDLSATEAAMRIAFLAQQFKANNSQIEALKTFDALALETSHIPILDIWKALPASEKKRFEAQRLSLEKKYAASINTAATELAKSV